MIYHVSPEGDYTQEQFQQLVDFLNGMEKPIHVIRYDEQGNPHNTAFTGAAVITGGIRLDTAPETSVE